MAVVGTLLAIQFNQGGNMIGITSIIGEKISSDAIERNQSTKEGLQKLQKELNQEFLQDIPNAPGGIKNQFRVFLDNLRKLKEEKKLLLSIPAKEDEEELLENKEKMEQFLRDLKMD